jgi:putative resolvase
MYVKLSVWAKKQGVCYRTAWRWFKANKLPSGIKMEQFPTGTVIVTESTPVVAVAAVGLYARVSSSDQKGDLEAQMGRLVSYASSQGWAVTRAVSEVGSGLNGRRAKLIKLLADPEVTTIVVEHRDRLMRFGVEYVEALLAAQGRRLIVVDHAEVKDDLVQDMIEVLTSFCARLYGRRSAKNRAEKAMKAMHG